MNIIFVDIDGPLLPRKMHMFHENRSSDPQEPPKFDDFAVRAFNLWTKYAQAKAVFSTYWTYSFTGDELKHFMESNGLELDYHDDLITPKAPRCTTRNAEICDWLRKHPEVERFIAVDDDTSCRYIEETVEEDMTIKSIGRWINVNFDNGISWENFCDGCNGLGINVHKVLDEEFSNKVDDTHHHSYNK